jgi:hypothetical protein
MHTYSQRVRFTPDSSVAWLGQYYTAAKGAASSAALGGGGAGADTVTALPWLASQENRKQPFKYITLRNTESNTYRARISLGFHDLYTAAFSSLAGGTSLGGLVKHLLEVTRQHSSLSGESAKWLTQKWLSSDVASNFTAATLLTADGRRFEGAAHSTVHRFRLRALAVLDSWAAFDPQSASRLFTVFFLGSLLLLFVGVQAAAGMCAIEIIPRLCCAGRAQAPGQEEESAQAAAYNKWYREQQALSAREKNASESSRAVDSGDGAPLMDGGARERRTAHNSDEAADHSQHITGGLKRGPTSTFRKAGKKKQR